MENGHPSLGLEDGTIDVEHLLVEPQDEHLSMDSIICFNEKIPKNAVSIEDISHSSGGSDTGIAQEGKDILNGEQTINEDQQRDSSCEKLEEMGFVAQFCPLSPSLETIVLVLNAIPSEVDVGYYRLENDLCSMGEEYLLGVEFAESITNLDYASSEGIHASVSDSQVLSTTGSDNGCRSDLFRTDNLRECQIAPFNLGSSKLSDTPCCRECETLSGENPTISPRSCTLQNSVKSQNSSSSSFQDVLSDENDGRFSQAGEMFCSPKTERNNDIELQDGATGVIKGEETLTTSVLVSSTDVLPTQKRSRKPTQRYICELVDPILTYPKRRREVSSTIKDKSLGVKEHKKCQIMGPKAIREPPEEFSVVAIQVPFGSLANKERSESHARDMEPRVDYTNSMTKSKGKCVAPQNQSKMDKCVTADDLKKRGDRGLAQKKTDGCVTEAQVKKKDGHATATNQKKRNNAGIAVIRKKRDDCFATDEGCSPAAHRKKRDDSLTSESTDEISGRRKHHRLWTISEVRKLIDGVSQYGVGRWSRIKKLFFSASAHRTSVDLKDKWRNLLKASGMQEQGSQQGEKKRNLAWRPLPKSILNRVCELAVMYPYPKGQRAKVARRSRESPERSTDITLSDYRRILRSINGN